MKQSPSDKELAGKLKPSVFSARGFLGSDVRPVDEIIGDDLRALARYRIPKETVAKALEEAYEKARAVFGAEVTLRPGVTVVFHESMGRVPSPFVGDGVFEKGEAVVTDKKQGQSLIITPLGIHLIKKHGFFQGKGSRYRINPVDAIEILGL